MPKFLEDRLMAEAASKGLTGRAADRYTYGALNNLGAMSGNVETAKGRAMDAKHARDVAAGRATPASAPAVTADLPHPHRNLGKFLHPPKRRR